MIEPEPDLQFIFEELTKKVHFQIITIDTQKKYYARHIVQIITDNRNNQLEELRKLTKEKND